jgi:hypothetical protein
VRQPEDSELLMRGRLFMLRSLRPGVARAAALLCVGSLLGASVVYSAGALPLRQRELAASGAWCWFADPRAVYHAGAHRRTYVGWVDARGSIQVASYDHDTAIRTVTTVKASFQIDDHANPSLLVRPDGRLIVFWSAHLGGRMYYRRSLRAEDITAWEAERAVPTNTGGGIWGYTYPNPLQLSAEGNRIWLFWRGGNFNPTFSTSDDEVTWAPARTAVSVPGQRPYLKVAGNGVDTIHLAFTQGHPRDLVTNIYYARYRAGNVYRANGTLIEPLSAVPFTPAQADLVYNAAAHGGVRAWVHDVAYDAAGRPVVTFATFPTNTDHRYHYARWDGTRWIDHEIARAGGTMSRDANEPHYSGGITLDHENPGQVYLARQVNGIFEVELWRTSDGGHSWTRRPVTGSSARGNYRPISPRAQTGADLNVVWMRGGYPSFTQFQTGIDAETLSRDVYSPAAVADGTGRLQVLAGEGTGRLIRKSYAGGWSGWEDLGRGPAGHILGPPAVTSSRADRLDLVAVDTATGHLLYRSRSAGIWGPWTDRGAGPAGHRVAAPAITSPALGRLEIVARDAVNNDLLRWSFYGSWNGPRRIAATPGGAFTPSITSWALGRLDVFAVTSTGRLAHIINNSGRWSHWESLGFGPGGVPYAGTTAVAAWEQRRLDVFAPSSNGRALLHRWFDGTSWRGPESLSAGTGPDRLLLRGIAVDSWAPHRLDVFSTNARTHGLLHTWFNGRWNGPERLDFAGPSAAVLADPNPNPAPIPVDPRVLDLAGGD